MIGEIAGHSHQPLCVRIRQAVQMTGISRSRIYELLRAGDIEYIKVGSSTLILVESLHQFINSQRAWMAQNRPKLK